jgi:hypothetical protein
MGNIRQMFLMFALVLIYNLCHYKGDLEVKAELIYQEKFLLVSRLGVTVSVSRDLYRIGEDRNLDICGPRYRYSWIAFDAFNPDRKVLFDSHPPKGPHFHIDGNENETSLEGLSLKECESLFFEIIFDHFDIYPKELP